MAGFLPPNSTPLETDVLQSTDSYNRLSGGADAVRVLKYQSSIPEDFIAFLAHEYGLSEVYEDLKAHLLASGRENDYKSLLDQGVAWQRIRGTEKAIDTALFWRSLNLGALEKEELGKRFAEYLYGVRGDKVIAESSLDDMIRLMGLSAPFRSRLARVHNEQYDLRRVKLDEHGFGGALLSDYSGVYVTGKTPKFSFGRVLDSYSVANPVIDTGHAQLTGHTRAHYPALSLKRKSSTDYVLGAGTWRSALRIDDYVWAVDTVSNHARRYRYSGGTFTRSSAGDVSLGAGSWGGFVECNDWVWFVDYLSESARRYSHSNGVLTRSSAGDLSIGNGFWFGTICREDYVWFIDAFNGVAERYEQSGGILTRSAGENGVGDVSLGLGHWYGAVSVYDRVWFTNNGTKEALAYTYADGLMSRDSNNDQKLPSGEWWGGLYIDHEVWFLNDSSDSLVGYEYTPDVPVLETATTPSVSQDFTSTTIPSVGYTSLNVAVSSSSINETESITLTASITGGKYDTVSYAWSITSGSGTIITNDDGDVATFTSPSVDGNQGVTVRCVATLTGVGVFALVGTTTATKDSAITVTDTTPTAVAPTVSLNSVANLLEGRSQIFNASISGGTYDSISYAWTVVSGGGTITGTGASVTYTAPAAVSSDTAASVRCTVTGTGTGVLARLNSTNSSSATEAFTVKDLANAVAPTVSINFVGSIRESGTIPVAVSVSGGSYDYLAYAWTVVSGGGAIFGTGTSVIYEAPAVSSNTTVTVRCTVTAHGLGTNVISGSSNSASGTQTLTVTNSTLPGVTYCYGAWGSAVSVSTAAVSLDTASAGLTYYPFNTSTAPESESSGVAWTESTGSKAQIACYGFDSTDREYRSVQAGGEWSDTIPDGYLGSTMNTGSDTGVRMVQMYYASGSPDVNKQEYTVGSWAILYQPTATTQRLAQNQSSDPQYWERTKTHSPMPASTFTATAGNSKTTLAAALPTNGNGGSTITKWQYRYKTGNGDYGLWKDIASSAANSITGKEVTGLTNGVLYTFQIRAVNSCGNGAAWIERVSWYSPPNASAPTVTIGAVSEVNESSTQAFTASVSGGAYDSISYAWSVVSGGGTIEGSGADATYTAAAVDTSTAVTVRCTATVTGEGSKAKSGTSATASDTEAFTVLNVLPDASAPTVVVTAIASVNEGSSQSVSASISGGTYDSVAYAWSVVSGGGTIAGTSATATYTPPAVNADTTVTIRCTVTASGTGTKAKSGTTSTSTDDEEFTVIDVTPNAVAPTVTIAAVSSITEESTQSLTASVTGGTYDSISYSWTVVTGGGSISGSGATATYTPVNVSSDTSVTVRCTVTATGDGTDAKDGSTASAQDDESFTVTDLTDASAPAVTVAAISSVNEGATQTLSASISGGTYDSVSYAWTIVAGGGAISGSGASVTYTAPSVASDTSVTVRCTVTASGTGTNADDGSSDTAQDDETFTVTAKANASAPTVTVGAVDSLVEGNTQALSATISGGTYDSISYAWTVVSGGGTITGSGASATYTPANVSVDTSVTVRCTVTATGDGTNAEDGTSDTGADDETFTVTFIRPDAVAPTVTVGAIGTISEGAAQSLSATISGGTYDSVSYAWTVQSGGGTITGSGDKVTYTSGAISSDTTVTVRCTVTATGNGTTAANSTSDTAYDDEDFTVTDAILAAVAPTVTVAAVSSVTEGKTQSLSASISGGSYDTVAYAWSVVSGGGTISGTSASATYTAPNVASDTTVTVRCTVTASGTGTNATDGTSATASDDEAFTVSDLPDADAPTVSIGSVSTITEAGTQSLTASISGGTYDSLVYAWTVVSGGGTISGTTATATYTPADISVDTSVTVRCTVTASGTGTNAENSSSDTATGDQTFTVTYTRPDAVAPTITVAAVTSVVEGKTQALSASISGGTYDSVSYAWTIVSGGGSISGSGSTATYTAANVASDTTVTVRCTVTASGTGTNAKDSTTATANDTEAFTVTDLPDASAPTVTVAAVSSVNEGATQALSASVSGGTYDSILYAWEVVSGGGTISGVGASVTYTAPSVNADTTVTVKCTVTASGTGTNAENSTSDTASDNEAFTVNNVLPVAVAPTVTIAAVSSVTEEGTQSLTASISGGTYDSVSYAWTVVSGGGTISGTSATATYTAVNVSSDTTVTVRCTVTATGTGTVARNNTTANANDTEAFTVTDITDAVAPTVTVAAVTSVTEGKTQALSASISGGTYDTIGYAWSVVSGGGSIVGSGSTATYTAPSVSSDTTATVRCTVTATGTGTNADNGSSATASDDESFTVADLPNADAPTVTIAAVSSVNEDSTLSLTATISGGTYDSLAYAWTVVSGGGTISGTSASATYTPADVSVDTSVTVRCTVTASGTGTNAENSTTDTETDDEVFTVTYTRPDAVAPSVTVASVTEVTESATQTLSASISGGTYDSISYAWTVVTSGGGSISGSGASVTYTAPSVSSDTSVTVRCTVTASGSGTTAKSGTSATAQDDEVFTVKDDSAPAFANSASIANRLLRQNVASSSIVLPSATGGNGTLSYSISPALPTGLSFAASTRTLSGTPSVLDPYETYTYTVADSDTNTASTDEDTLTFGMNVTPVPTYCYGSWSGSRQSASSPNVNLNTVSTGITYFGGGSTNKPVGHDGVVYTFASGAQIGCAGHDANDRRYRSSKTGTWSSTIPSGYIITDANNGEGMEANLIRFGGSNLPTPITNGSGSTSWAIVWRQADGTQRVSQAYYGGGYWDRSKTHTPEAPITFTATPSAGVATLAGSLPTGGNGGSTITKWQYRAKKGTESYGSWTDIVSSASNSITGKTITRLDGSTTYTFQGRAVNSCGNGAVSGEPTAAVTPGIVHVPTVTIGSVSTVAEGATQALTATVSGGVYDSLAYAWSVVSGGGTISGSGNTATYTAPQVSQDTTVSVRCTVTASGSGVKAGLGISNSTSDDESFTVEDSLSNASAPTVTINSVSSVDEGRFQTFTATLSGGTYDSVSYAWSMSTGSGTITGTGASVTYLAPLVQANTSMTIQCTVTATGSGTLAKNGTTDTGSDTEQFTVNEVSTLLVPKTSNDLSLGSGTWEGGFAIGNNVWFVDDSSNYARGYTHSSGTLSRASGNDLSLGSGTWNGGFAIGNNVWFVDDSSNYARGYTHSSGTLSRASGNDLSLGSGTWNGGFAIGNNVWFVDSSSDYARGYTHSSGTLSRASGNDLSLGSGTWGGGFAIGNNVWFVDDSSDYARGYTHSSGTLSRASGNDLSLGSGTWNGGFAIGNNVWFVDSSSDYARGYEVSAKWVKESDYDLSLGSGTWEGGFAIGNNVWFVDDSSDYARGYTHSSGTLSRASGNDLSLGSGTWNGGFAIGNNVWFVDSSSDYARGYTHSSGTLSRASGNDLSLGSGTWEGGFAIGNNVWFVDNSSNYARGYTHSSGTLSRASGNDLSLGSGTWNGGFAIGNNVWFVDDSSNYARGYTHSSGTLSRASGNDLSLGSGIWEGGFAIGNNVWFVDNSSNYARGYVNAA